MTELRCKKCGSSMIEKHSKAINCAMCGNIVVRMPYLKPKDEARFVNVEEILKGDK